MDTCYKVGMKQMKKRIKEIFKKAAEFLKLGAYIRFSDYTDNKKYFQERKRKK